MWLMRAFRGSCALPVLSSSISRVFGNIPYLLSEMGHSKEMHAQKGAFPSQSTLEKLNLPNILTYHSLKSGRDLKILLS